MYNGSQRIPFGKSLLPGDSGDGMGWDGIQIGRPKRPLLLQPCLWPWCIHRPRLSLNLKACAAPPSSLWEAGLQACISLPGGTLCAMLYVMLGQGSDPGPGEHLANPTTEQHPQLCTPCLKWKALSNPSLVGVPSLTLHPGLVSECLQLSFSLLLWGASLCQAVVSSRRTSDFLFFAL